MKSLGWLYQRKERPGSYLLLEEPYNTFHPKIFVLLCHRKYWIEKMCHTCLPRARVRYHQKHHFQDNRIIHQFHPHRHRNHHQCRYWDIHSLYVWMYGKGNIGFPKLYIFTFSVTLGVSFVEMLLLLPNPPLLSTGYPMGSETGYVQIHSRVMPKNIRGILSSKK